MLTTAAGAMRSLPLAALSPALSAKALREALSRWLRLVVRLSRRTGFLVLSVHPLMNEIANHVDLQSIFGSTQRVTTDIRLQSWAFVG